MRRRSWTERQLGGVSSDGGGGGAGGGDDDVDCEEADNDDGCGGEAVDDGEADVFFSSEKLPKNCLLRSSRSFERFSPFLTGAKKY